MAGLAELQHEASPATNRYTSLERCRRVVESFALPHAKDLWFSFWFHGVVLCSDVVGIAKKLTSQQGYLEKTPLNFTTLSLKASEKRCREITANQNRVHNQVSPLKKIKILIRWIHPSWCHQKINAKARFFRLDEHCYATQEGMQPPRSVRIQNSRESIHDGSASHNHLCTLPNQILKIWRYLNFEIWNLRKK